MIEGIRIKYTDKVFVAVLAMFSLFQLAFYKMMIERGDNVEHLEFARSILSSAPVEVRFPHIKAYPLYHITTKIVSFLCIKDYSVAGMCVLIAANTFTILIIRYILNRYLDKDDVIKRYIVDGVSIAYLLFNAIAGPLMAGYIRDSVAPIHGIIPP